MKITRHRFLQLATCAAALPAMSRIAWTEAYPSRPVRWIVGYTPGGGNDIIARIMGQWQQERLGQPVVIENGRGQQSGQRGRGGCAGRRLHAPTWVFQGTA